MLDPLEEHYGYLADRVKRERYQATIDKLVGPEHVVLDLGCGSGMLGLMALRAGAKRVLFVEEGAVIEIARRTIAEADLDERAEFFQENSYKLELPELADIILCDHVGYFGFDYDILGMLADAKKRLLKPDGIIVPAVIELNLAPVESEACRKLVSQWRDGSVAGDYAWVTTIAANTKHAVNVEGSDLLAEPVTFASLELGDDAADFFTWQVDFACVRDATFDGLVGWFDCVLHDDIRMTNGPQENDNLDRSQAFLPLEEPISLKAGQRLEATIMARPHDHVIAWTISSPDTGQRFEFSTFNGIALENRLRKMFTQDSGQ